MNQKTPQKIDRNWYKKNLHQNEQQNNNVIIILFSIGYPLSTQRTHQHSLVAQHWLLTAGLGCMCHTFSTDLFSHKRVNGTKKASRLALIGTSTFSFGWRAASLKIFSAMLSCMCVCFLSMLPCFLNEHVAQKLNVRRYVCPSWKCASCFDTEASCPSVASLFEWFLVDNFF